MRRWGGGGAEEEELVALQMQGVRGKARFEEGEKILCYEPDPKKVKILYEAKILEVNRAKILEEEIFKILEVNRAKILYEAKILHIGLCQCTLV